MTSTILFDLDGTLVNTINAIIASHQYAFRTVCDREITIPEIMPGIGRTLKDYFCELEPDHVEELERVYIAHNRDHMDELVTKYDGIPKLLRDLLDAKIPVGIVTSKKIGSVIPSRRIGEIPEEIILACAADDTSEHKPHPAPLLKGAEKLGAEPGDCTYVGDAVVDLRAADAAGMRGIGVTWGAGTAEALRACPNDGICETVDELRAMLLPG